MADLLEKTIPVTSADGHRNQLTIWSPAAPKALVLMHPAMGVRAAYYAELGKAIAAQGLLAASVDLRGLGHSSLRASSTVDWGYEEMITQDFSALVEALRQAYPGLPLYLMGHSLGGQLSCLYASRHPDQVAGLILVACCSVYWRAWPGPQASLIWLTTQFYGLVAGMLGYFPGPKLGFGGVEPKTEMRDWSRQARTGRYELAGSSFGYEAALGDLRLPTLCLCIAGDRFAPPSAAQHLLDKFGPGEGRSPELISSAETGQAGLNHFKWAKQPAYFAERIRAFIAAHSS